MMESYFMHKDLCTCFIAGLWTKFFTIWSKWPTQQDKELISVEPKVNYCQVEQLYELKIKLWNLDILLYIYSLALQKQSTLSDNTALVFFPWSIPNADMNNVVMWCFAPFAKHHKLMNPSALFCSNLHTLGLSAHLLGVHLQNLYNIIH